jgi:hypothetical protein
MDPPILEGDISCIHGRQRAIGAAAHGSTLVAGTRGAGTAQATNSAQRAHLTQASTHPQGLTPAVMANNAAEETKKPPATKVVHQAWWHWIW